MADIRCLECGDIATGECNKYMLNGELVGVCDVCLEKKVNKGIKNRSWYDVEKLISQNGFKQL